MREINSRHVRVKMTKYIFALLHASPVSLRLEIQSAQYFEASRLSWRRAILIGFSGHKYYYDIYKLYF